MGNRYDYISVNLQECLDDFIDELMQLQEDILEEDGKFQKIEDIIKYLNLANDVIKNK